MLRLGWAVRQVVGFIGEALRRTGNTVLSKWQWFTGKQNRTSRLDYTQLDTAYRELPFLRPIVKLSVGMMLANGFEVVTEDERARESLGDFWARSWGRLRKACRDGALYGDAYLGVTWNRDAARAELVVRHPGQVYPMPDPLEPERIESFTVKVTDDAGKEWTQKITRERVEVRMGSVLDEERSGPNPYGLLPLVHVAEDPLSHELFGTGDVDEKLFRLCEMYDDLSERMFDHESYHGMPVPTVTGVSAGEVDGSQLEPGKVVTTTNKEAKFGFWESARGSEGARELLKKIYHAIIVQARTPEFLLGVHMESAHASTKEQRSPIEMKTEERRDAWSEAILHVNRLVLAMEQYHLGRRYPSTDTAIEWGPIFERDKKEEAETEKMRTDAVALQVEAGLTSRETAVGLLHDDPEAELERLEAEAEERDEG